MISFTCPFVASFKRPRPGRWGGYFSPHAKMQKQIGFLALEARQKQQASILEGDIDFQLLVYSKWGKKGLKQDLDNVLKCVIDGCQGVLFENDRQVKQIFCRALQTDKSPRMEIEVSEL